MDHTSDSPDPFPIIDAIDQEIIMHRDAHFGGQFPIMLEYYQQEGKGVQPEFTLARIERLAQVEKELKENLAGLFLSGYEAQKVADAKQAYLTLRSIYEIQKHKSPFPKFIADLILTEEEDPEAEIAAIVGEKEKIVPELIQLLSNEVFYDPLFPGYGQVPDLAVRCLAQIGDKRAIISLFQAMGKGDFFADDQILKALKVIGLPARDFLCHVLKGRPLNEDNEKAAIALIAFKEDEEVSDLCWKLLQEPDIQKDLCLSTYLVLVCAGIKDATKRQAFQKMAEGANLPVSLKEDMKAVTHEWQEADEKSV